MKKLIALFACLTLFTTVLIAQQHTADPNSDDPFEREFFEDNKTSTQIIIPEDQHCTDKNASVKIEYSPVYDEVRIYYETLYVTYDRGEAMNTVMACLQDFQKEHKYFHYRYLKDDKERFFKGDRGQRKAQYFSYVKFSR